MKRQPDNPDKVAIQKIVNTWIDRADLKISYIANRMQLRSPVPISPDNFGNLFLYHAERRPNIDPAVLEALITVFSVDIPSDTRCTADEVIDLIVRVPMPYKEFEGLIERIKRFFPEQELINACLRHGIYLNFGTQLEEMRKVLDQLRQQYGDFVLRFLTDQLVRGRSRDRYWDFDNTDRVSIIILDREWKTIKQVLTWVAQEKQELLIELVLLLVHYMDDRMLYSDRLLFSGLAADAASALPNRQWEEAILRIDALGWIHLELDQLRQAEDQITRGLHIAERLLEKGTDATELVVLAKAWLARVHLQRYLREGDLRQLEEAHRTMGSIEHTQCRPVILNRVKMIAGDIALHDAKLGASKAIDYYQQALSYYGLNLNVDGFMLINRLGVGYMKVGEVKQAEAQFQAILAVDEEWATSNAVRAQFNMAQIDKLNGDLVSARSRTVKVRNRLARLNVQHPMLEDARAFLLTLDGK
ncbi:MAG: hypothetical protein KF716_19310 [Anaerolineae bacterium]|nr:hypothetical protein [Anaerolineae bacterium]